MRALTILALLATAPAYGQSAYPTSPPPLPAKATSQPGNPTGTTNGFASRLMMGLAGSITPRASGDVLITLSGEATNNTSGSGLNVQIRYGTGAAPANGAAFSGTACGNVPGYTVAAVSQRLPFSITCIATGLTLGTAIWIDATVNAITSGTGAISSLTIAAAEQ